MFYKQCKKKTHTNELGEKKSQEVFLFRNNISISEIVQKEALDKPNVFYLEVKEDFIENILIF